MSTNVPVPPPAVSLIVPTYREAESLPALLDRVGRLRAESGIPGELVLVDDDSRDGTEELVRSRGEEWVRLIVRRGRRDLSLAVLEGFGAARGEIFAVMDADLSHPPEVLPRMVAALHDGYDFVLGSRYVPGGSMDKDWGVVRRTMSRTGMLTARVLTPVRDPMSGFFALRRTALEAAGPLDPIGYKIGLELLTKCRPQRVLEVPIHFTDRRAGRSKFNVAQQLRFLRHVWRLVRYRLR